MNKPIFMEGMMIASKDMRACWLELHRIARTEVILDKIEEILGGLEIPQNDEMFLLWEEMCELNGEQLSIWHEAVLETWHYDHWQDEWLRIGWLNRTASSTKQTSDGA
jgi:hypothetical protein